jgi:hypothetical protein
MATSTKKKIRAPRKSPPEAGAPDILPLAPLRVRPGDRVDVLIRVCTSPMRVRVYLDGTLMTEQTGTDEIAISVPTLQPGFHLLYWNAIVPPGVPWQTRAEVSVAGLVRFRRRRADTDKNPTGTGWVDLDVVP